MFNTQRLGLYLPFPQNSPRILLNSRNSMDPPRFSDKSCLEFFSAGFMMKWMKFHRAKISRGHSSSLHPDLLAFQEIRTKRAFVRKLDLKNINIEFVNDWIRVCRECHSQDCAAGDSCPPLLKVIDCLKGTVVTIPAGSEYLALSYVWGSSERNDAGDSESNLSVPPVIRDAGEVTRRLGYRYLWVDRYCIDQNNSEDIHFQINRYTNVRLWR